MGGLRDIWKRVRGSWMRRDVVCRLSLICPLLGVFGGGVADGRQNGALKRRHGFAHVRGGGGGGGVERNGDGGLAGRLRRRLLVNDFEEALRAGSVDPARPNKAKGFEICIPPEKCHPPNLETLGS